MEHVGEVLNGNFKLPSEVAGNMEKVVEQTFYKIDGCAHKRVADAVLDAVNSAKSSTSIDKCRDFAYDVNHGSLKARVVTSIKKTLGLSPHWSFKRWKNVVGELAWDHSEKYFDADTVRAIVDAIQACIQAERGEPSRRVGVRSSQERGDYHFGYRQGRSVTVFPQ